jgi:hypothetical protein
MDEMTNHATPLDPDPGSLPDPPTGPVSARRVAQEPLPFDDDAEEPIGFALTARARRTVAPEAVPSLRVVGTAATASPIAPGDVDTEPLEEDRSDTRPARARALRRAGTDTRAIARQLGVDELLVRAWIDGVGGSVRRARSAGRSGLGAASPGTNDLSDANDLPEADDDQRAAFELARADARRQAGDRLALDPRLAAGLGVLAGTVEVDATAVTLSTGDPRVAGAVCRWLRDVLGLDPALLRVVLRVGPSAAGDLVRHRWGRALDLAPDRLRTTRWPAAPIATDVEALVRIVDDEVAAAVAGWRDALLDGDLDVDDASF